MSNSKRIKQAIKPTALMKPGVTVLRIEHDDDCAYWKRRQADDCTCNSNVRVVRPFDRPLGVN